jgi:hypothetical protein
MIGVTSKCSNWFKAPEDFRGSLFACPLTAPLVVPLAVPLAFFAWMVEVSSWTADGAIFDLTEVIGKIWIGE